MQPNPDDEAAPRETAAGLERGGRQVMPPTAGSATRKANPASQSNLWDDRSSPDQQDPRTKSQTGKHVTADKWNQ